MIHLQSPITREDICRLKAGDIVYLSATIYTARDQAHERLTKTMAIDLNNAIIYYTGPTPTRPNDIVGSIGPTSSYRMDKYGLFMAESGMLASIGKGQRSEEFRKLCQEYQMVYFVATGGVGALMHNCVKNCEIVAFKDLDTEAIRKLEVVNMPLIVAYDTEGNSIFRGDDNE